MVVVVVCVCSHVSMLCRMRIHHYIWLLSLVYLDVFEVSVYLYQRMYECMYVMYCTIYVYVRTVEPY